MCAGKNSGLRAQCLFTYLTGISAVRKSLHTYGQTDTEKLMSVLVQNYFNSSEKKKIFTAYGMIYLSTAIGLPPGDSSTVHIYTQTVHRTT
jgi:hypothetical protein